MMQELKYDWQLEGDLDTTVSLVLCCNCKVDGLSLRSVTIDEVVCENVELCLRRHKTNIAPTTSDVLWTSLRSWFAERFRQLYDDNQSVQEEIRSAIEGPAINTHWEVLSNP